MATNKNTTKVVTGIVRLSYANVWEPASINLSLFMDIVLLSKCAELWVFGDTISKGMRVEIERARHKGQPIRYFTEDCQEVLAV